MTDLPQIPDDLLSALDDYEGVGAGADTFIVRESSGVNLRRIEIVQENNKNHPKVVKGQLTLGRFALVKGTKDEMEAEYVDHLDLLLIDPLFYTDATLPADLKGNPDAVQALRRDKGIGGRMMWRHNESGNREVVAGEMPICSSPNGLTPWPRNLGQEIADPRYASAGGQPIKHRIGYKLNHSTLSYESVENPCLSCPFAQWVGEKESADGKRKKPMCSTTFEYIVYDLERDEMFRLKGNNPTVQNALLGANAGAFGCKHDGSALPGLMWHFALTGMKHADTGEVITVAEYVNKLKAATPEMGAVLRQSYYPVHRNRPQGSPSKARWDVPVFAVRMTLTQAQPNGRGTQPFIPQFTVLDGTVAKIDVYDLEKTKKDIDLPVRSLSTSELAAYLRTQAAYQEDGLRDTLMGFGASTNGFTGPLLNAPPAVSPPALNSGGNGNGQTDGHAPVVKPPVDEINLDDPFAHTKN